MRRRWRRGTLALLAWFAGVAAQTSMQPGSAPRNVDLQAAVTAGPRAWPALQEWGLGCRWRGAASDARQHARDGCGPAALGAVLAHHQRHLPQELLWSMCRLPGGGTTLGRLARTSRAFGQTCEVQWCSSWADLPLPAIVHLRRGHFVVAETRRSGWVTVLDPACGRVCVPDAVLARRASGAVLVFSTSLAAAHPRLVQS